LRRFVAFLCQKGGIFMANQIKKKFIEEIIFSDLTDEINIAVQAEADLRSAADSALQGDIDSEIARATAAEGVLQGNIDSEVSRATTAEAGLQSSIDTEKARIDAILSASTADADSFKEIVDLINSVDTENDTAFAGYVMSNDAALAAEVSARETLEGEFDAYVISNDAALASEVSARETLEGEFDAYVVSNDAALAAEVSSRETLEGEFDAYVISNDAALAAEVSRSTTAEAGLQSQIDNLNGSFATDDELAAEAALRSAADSVLESSIDAEVSARETLEGEFDAYVISNDAALASEVSSRETLEGEFDAYVISNDAALAAEQARAEGEEAAIRSEFDAADSALHTTISAEIDADVLAEKTRAEAAEGGLQTAIDNEAALRSAADSTVRNEFAAADSALHTTISAEIDADVLVEKNRAEAAEAGLQSSIDTEKARVDAILDASEADKDSFAEIVTLINSVDTENDTAFASYVMSNDAAVAALQADVDQNELDGDNDRAAIRSEFAAADSALHTTISAEIDADVLVEKTRAEGEEAAIRSEFAAADSALESSLKGDAGANYDTLGKLEDLNKLMLTQLLLNKQEQKLLKLLYSLILTMYSTSFYGETQNM
jgi:hypothetical protein